MERAFSCKPLAGAVTIFCMAAFPARAQNYLTDLGAVAPGLAINNAGQVSLRNNYYSGGVLVPYPASFTASSPDPNLGFTAAGGISSNGVIAGVYAPNPNAGVATFDIGTTTVTEIPTSLGALDPSIELWGTGVNSSSTVTGYMYFPNGNEGQAFLVSGGTLTMLGFPNQNPNNFCSPGGSVAYSAGEALAINDGGTVTGYLPNTGYGLFGPNTGWGPCQDHIFIYAGGNYSDLAPGYGTAINANGAVTGNTFKSLQITQGATTIDLGAFLYYSGTFTLLGGGADIGFGINVYNFIVGDGSNSAGSQVAFFFDGVVNDLNSFILPTDPLYGKVTLTDARGINDLGLVVVNGVNLSDSTNHAYLLQVPLLQVSGPVIFPSVALGSTSQPQTVTFTNNSTAAITLGGASIPSGTAFSIQRNNCGATLAVGANCSIAATYKPAGAGTPSSVLTLVAGGVPIAVPMSASSPLAASISSSAPSTTTGAPVVLTWTATAGASCTATGGSAADGWTGSIASSGTQKVSETAPASYTYGISCMAGTEQETAQVTVVVSYPSVTAQISANPTSLTTGAAVSITWSSTNATSCSSTGGGSNDGWPNTSRPTKGSVSITEPNPVVSGASETLTFTMTCSAATSGKSASASVKVTQLAPSSSGGGGAIDTYGLLVLGGVLAVRRAKARERPSDGL